LTLLAAALAGQSAAAVKLSGPRGIVPARSAAGSALGASLARRRAGRERGRALTQVGPVSPLAKAAIPKLDYHDGPVMHTNHVYVIFWQPSSLPSEVDAFSAHTAQHVSYEEAVDNYFEAVAHDSGTRNNAYSVATQYGAGTPEQIEYASSFDAATQTTLDSDAYPKNECVDEEPQEGGGEKKLPVCLDEAELQGEIKHVIEAKHWPTGLEDLYFLYTPEGVGGCFAAGEESSKGGECSYSDYCAYHYNFAISGQQAIFANMPYEDNYACTDGAEPEGSDAGPAIDASSHEHNESITDPTGEGWWDGEGEEATNSLYGEEEADLCLPETFSASYNEEVYGPLLGGAGYETASAYNQVIDGRHYLLQREWSESAGPSVGACAQRLLPAAFTPPSGAQAGQSASFDASASGTAEYPATSWKWNFGDGSSKETHSPTIEHTYAAEGEYTVTLTVTDADGDANTTSQRVSVTAGITTTMSSSTSSSTSNSSTSSSSSASSSSSTSSNATTTSSTQPVGRLSDVELAAALGLPPNGGSLSATQTLTFGHVACPSACTVSASLYTVVHTTHGHHRTTKRELIGAGYSTGVGSPLRLKLNSTGQALLRRQHRLVVQLVVSAAGVQLTRTVTLTLPRHAAHKRR
jgi:PKD repeat protein